MESILKYCLAMALFIISGSSPLFAQRIQIQGQVMAEGRPCPYAEVHLLQDSVQVSETLSDSSGHYQFQNIKRGYYILDAFWNEHFTGQIALTDTQSPDVAVNILLDSIHGEQGHAITITAHKPLIEKRADRTILNVENAVSLTGGTALEAITKAPGITVNDKTIQMIGKSSLTVMINDRPVQLSGNDLINYLKSLPADAIRNIEVITTPPARYDAAGNSGIINIVLKKGKTDSWSNQVASTTNYAKYWTQRFSDVFTFNKNGLRIFANTTAGKSDDYQSERTTIYYPNDVWDGPSLTRSNNKYVYGSVAADYDLNSQTTIGAQLSLFRSRPDNEDSTLTTRVNDQNILQQYLWSKGNSYTPSGNQSFNTHFTHTFDSLGKKLSVDADYYHFSNKNDRDFYTQTFTPANVLTDYNSYLNASNQNFHNVSFKADMEHPTGRATITYGIKYSHSQTDNRVTFYDKSTGEPVYDPARSDHFVYTEKISAAYGDIAKNFGNKWETKIGLRAEYTHTQGTSISYNEDIERKYFKIYPTAYVLYKANDHHFFNINYSRRVQRPDFWSLNPFRWYINQFAYAVGNPYLQPSFSNNFELSHTFRNALTTTLSYTYGQQLYTQYPDIDNTTKIIVYRRDNLLNYHSYVLTESYNTHFFPWWESNSQLVVYYQRFRNLKPEQTDITLQNGLGTYISTNQTLTLNSAKTLYMSINYWTQPYSKDGIFTNQFSGSLDVGVKALLFQKKMTVALNTWDLFRTNKNRGYGYNNDIKTAVSNFYNSRFISLAVRYTFGNTKLDQSARHQSGNDIGNRIK